MRKNEIELNRLIYHSTTEAGAGGIIARQSFWSTAHDCTNDDSELISANAAVISVSEACLTDAKEGEELVLDKFVELYRDTMLTDLGIVYLVCFSTAREVPAIEELACTKRSCLRDAP